MSSVSRTVTRAGVPQVSPPQPGAQTQEEQDTLGPQIDAAQHAWFMAFMDRLFGAAV